MLRIHLGWQCRPDMPLQAAVGRTAGLAMPPLPGLLARQWLHDRSGVQGAYLFRDDGSVWAFLACPGAEPAYAALAAQVASAPPMPAQLHLVPASLRAPRPVFIIAAPRSGSTLLFDLLAQAPGLLTQGGEGQGAVDGVAALHMAARGYESDRLDDTHLTPEIEACLHAGWCFGLRDRDGVPVDMPFAPTHRLLDKTTEHCLRVSLLARACPDARFVLLHRDARQNISSLIQAWRHDRFVRLRDLSGWPGRDWCFLLPPGWTTLRGRSLQSVATAQWEAAYRWALHDLEMLDTDRWIPVDYNELVAQPRRVLARLCEFLGIEFDDYMQALLARPLTVSASAISPPSVIKWRSNHELDVPQLELATRNTSSRLRHLQSGSPPAEPGAPTGGAPAAPSVRFACHLAEVLPGGIAALAAGTDDNEPPIVDPVLCIQFGNTVPLGLTPRPRFRECFLDNHPILWMPDRLTGAWTPFWIARGQVRQFQQFQPGAPAPPCPPLLEAQLRAAGIIASRAERTAAEQQATAVRGQLRSEFAERGCCVVPGVLPASHCAALARYYQALIAAGGWELGDQQVAQRHGWHNESVARFFHHQLIGFVSAVAGQPVFPAYAYVSAYQNGAELDPHIDRKQCEYTLSVIFEQVGGCASEWPLWFLEHNRPSAVTLDVGDGMLFLGHDLPHWRELPPRAGLALSTLLLHYVPANFKEVLC